PSLVKYRKLFSEVLIVSFSPQLFAMVSPIFFQAVMDKVLVHRGFTTQDVLAIGFFVIVLFEGFLGGLKMSIKNSYFLKCQLRVENS
ncbi:hypothetical protein Q6294_31295, partial [Klebsiella pneumoniae]|nr:hypothetical protein [Klebsiella pneumoniae]